MTTDKQRLLKQLDDCEPDPYKDHSTRVKILTPGTDPTSMNVPIAFRVGDKIMLSTLPGMPGSSDQLRLIATPHEATDEELVSVSGWAVMVTLYKVIMQLLACMEAER